MGSKISVELNSAELIKYALFKDYHLPKDLANLNLTQERILMTIKNSLNLSMVAIARAVGLEKGPFSQTVDKLEALGLLKRIRSQSDKRLIHLQLTVAGTEMANKVEASMESHFSQQIALLTEAECEELFSALAALKKIAQLIISK